MKPHFKFPADAANKEELAALSDTAQKARRNKRDAQIKYIMHSDPVLSGALGEIKIAQSRMG
jgi:hypothetical protein